MVEQHSLLGCFPAVSVRDVFRGVVSYHLHVQGSIGRLVSTLSSGMLSRRCQLNTSDIFN
jgi:hypothetical protein